jgi:hypothetical protein
MGSQDLHVHTHREATGESELYIVIMLSFSIQHIFQSMRVDRIAILHLNLLRITLTTRRASLNAI